MLRRPGLPLVSVSFGLFFAYACGSNDNKDATFPPGSTADASDDISINPLNPDADASAVPPDGAAPATCGGAPCASYTGPKSFADPSAPPNGADLFNGNPNPNGTDAGKEPKIIYLNHETMFPLNVSHIRHEWSKGGTNNVFRLHFVGPNTTVDVVTANANWEPTDEEWDW